MNGLRRLTIARLKRLRVNSATNTVVLADLSDDFQPKWLAVRVFCFWSGYHLRYNPSSEEQGKWIENYITPLSNCPKATEYHLGLLKAKLARYRAQLLEPTSKSGGQGTGFDVQKAGDARISLIGI